MPDQADRAILSPSQLNTLARSLLEDAFPLVTVEGELGNLSRPASGHLYFTLKDARAQVRCAMFRPKSTWLRFQPREGLKVLARGRLTLYEARGDCQLILDSLEEAGEGALRRAFDALKAALQAQGLFDAARKRDLPVHVRRLGVLTSPSGAAVRDVISVLGRRFPLLDVDVLPVPVQGDGAAALITGMLQRAAASGRYDALLLTRGGGSLEDLWAFNDEALVRAIAAAPVPVVAAIGHETDSSLAEFAADLRAPTPSAAAELLVPDRRDRLTALNALHRRARTHVTHRCEQAAQQADRLSLRLRALHPQARLDALAVRQASARRRLQAAYALTQTQAQTRVRQAAAALRLYAPQARIAQLAQRLARVGLALHASPPRQLQRESLRLQGAVRALAAVSPLATLARGYAIVSRADDGRIVRGVGDAGPDAQLEVRLADGTLQVQVAPGDT